MKATSTTHLPAHAHMQFTDISLEDPRLATDIARHLVDAISEEHVISDHG
jgi:hypothetical protein